jgi:hypothetical protein
MNLYYPTGYWEWRFLFFIFAAASILAPIAMLRAGKHVFPENWKVKRVLFSTLLIGIVVLGGMSSTFLTLELQIDYLPSYTTSQQTVALSFFSDLLKNNTLATLLTIPESSSISSLLPISYSYENLLPAIWKSEHPEVPLSILYNLKYLNTFVYLSDQDLGILNKEYKDGYVCSHLLNSIPTVLETSDVQISKLPDGVPPSLNSKTVLVMPSDSSSNRNGLFAYEMLSLSGYNFTVMLDSDNNILNSNVIILPFDKSTDISREILDNLGTSSKKLVVLNLDGYGPFSKSFLEGKAKINATLNSSGGNAFLHSPSDYAAASTVLEGSPLDNSMEFIVDNHLEANDPTIIARDEQTLFWRTLTNNASSSLALTNDSIDKVNESDSLKQTWNISANGWAKVYHSWNSDQNWTNKDFLTFYWKGSNTGSLIQAGIYAPDALNMQRWVFYDNFSNWQRFVFPLNTSSEGWQVGNPDLARVRQLEFFVSPGSQSVNAVWHLDRFLLDVGRWIDIKIIVMNNSGTPSLSNFNGLSYVPIPIAINASEKVSKQSICYLDGRTADELYGEDEIARVSEQEIQGGHQLILSIKMPPNDGRDSETNGVSQSRFKVEFSGGGEFNATRIVGKESKINLPLEIEVYPSSVKDNVESLASYENSHSEAVFAARKTVGQSEIIYINVYPLIKTILSNDEEEASRDLYSILGSLLDMAKIDAPPYDRHVISWIMDDSTPFLIFNDATLNGDVSVKSTSLCLPSGITLERANIEYNGHVLSLDNVTSLSINAGNKINISAQEMEIGKGEGFYSTITVNNPEISIEGANPHLTLTLANGSIVKVNGESKVKLSVPAQLQIYVRDPSVQVDGFVIFREAYAIHSYQTTLMTLGQELKIQGNIIFEVPLSDIYSFATELVWRGSFERSPPLLPWNELGSLSESIPWLIVSSLLFIILFLACTRARGRELKIKLKIKRQQSL